MIQKMCSIVNGTGDDFSACVCLCVSLCEGEKNVEMFAIITTPPPPQYRSIAFEVA